MKNVWVAFFSGALLVASVTADAQKVTRVRGAVTAFDGKVLTVKVRDGQTTKVLVADNTEIVFTQPITISDIKPGDFLGVTSAKGADGSLTAFEIRRFPKAVNPGHRPFDGRDDQTMTNATVSAVVQATKGRELTLTYDGGAQKIVVPEDASISMLVPGERAHFVEGAIVNLTATPGADGQLTARRIQVSKPKPERA
ncbi:MAG: DUF5666 domain-containing protein [Betaproteobacteria bacterium]